ncbi:MAG: FG-GAP-like repeat-containing protein, partial [Bacteroidales bacterium]|nr:FG-GAP-like repeat-containing protein [Bacteroidales bacterium]
MKKIYLFIVFFCPLFLFADRSTVIISEVLYDTPLQETTTQHDGEFISLYNYSNDEVDISGWRIEARSVNGVSPPVYTFVFPDNAQLNPQSLAVVAFSGGNGFNLETFYGTINVNGRNLVFYNNTLTLPNGRSDVKVYDADNNLQDEIIYNGDDAGQNGEYLLRATNGFKPTAPGYESLSVQRKNITIENDEHVFVRTDYYGSSPKRPVVLFSLDGESDLTISKDGETLSISNYNEEYAGGGSLAKPLQGSLSVSATGAATYTIPIEVPQGVRGMNPQLALTYNSQSGMGIAGLGFHLQGLSAITRTGKNLFYDGERRNDFSEFMLDGQRLKVLYSRVISLDTGEIWDGDLGPSYSPMDFTVYETAENPSFSDIRRTHSNDRFIVKTREGMTLYYGDNANSSLRHSVTNLKLSYLLREVVDGYGNKITYTYETVGGQSYIAIINYGSSSSTLGTEIRFTYTENSLSHTKYLIGGHQLSSEQLLSGIEIYSAGGLLYRYEFEYETPAEKAYTILKKINKINGTSMYGFPSTATELPLSFVWSDVNTDAGSVGVTKACAAGTYNDYYEQNQYDGITDPEYSNSMDYNSVYTSGDVDGDGSEDVIRFGWKYVNIYRNAFFSGNNGIAYNSDFTKDPYGWKSTRNPRFIIDMNGDGSGDLVGRGNQKISISFSNGFIPPEQVRTLNDQFTETTLLEDFGISNGWGNPESTPVLFGDIDGDGLTDVMGINNNGGRIYLNKNGRFGDSTDISHEFIDAVTGNNKLYRGYKLLDIDGDGKCELLVLNNVFEQIDEPGVFNLDDHKEYFKIYAVSGLDDPFFADNIKTIYRSKDKIHDKLDVDKITPAYGDANHHLFGDLNGDGLLDMVALNRSSLDIHYSCGTGIYNSSPDLSINEFTLNKGYGDLNKNPVSLGDVNGDGLLDIIGFAGSNESLNSELLVLLNTGNGFVHKNWGTWTNDLFSNQHPYHQRKEKLLCDFNGDGLSDACVIDYDRHKLFTSAYGGNKDFRRLVGIDNGNDVNTSIAYNNYKKTQADTFSFPFREVSGLDVVSEVTTTTSDNTIAAHQKYSYDRAVADIRRGGLLGFLSTIETDLINNTSVTTVQKLDTARSILYPYKTEVFLHENSLSDKKLLSTEEYSYIEEPLNLPRSGTIKYMSGMRLDDEEKHTVEFKYNYINGDGNKIKETSLLHIPSGPIMGGSEWWESESDVRYIGYETYGYVQRPSIKITASGYTGRLLKDTTYYTYNAKGDILTETTVEGTTETIYNNYGLPELVTFTPAYNPDNSVTTLYDHTSDNRFVKTITDDFGTTTKEIDLKYGRLKSETDIFGRTKYYNYDNYGRIRNTTDKDGVKTTFTESNNGKTLHTKTSLGASSYTYYDELGREIKTSMETADGTIITETVYDNKGRVSKKSEPYFENSNSSDIFWHNYSYDNQGRLTQTEYLGDITTYAYTGLTTTVTEHAGTTESRITSKTYNATGDVIKSTEPSGEITYHYYYPGLPDTIKSGDIKTIIGYDTKGRRTSIQDPSAGTTTFEYDNLNRLTKQRDGNGTTSTFTYDKYGREISRTVTAVDKPENGDTVTITNTYNGINGALSASTINGQEGGDVTNSYTYDDAGRVISETQSLENNIFTTSYTYNDRGRQESKTYPNGFGIEYKYNSYGELSQITNLDDGSNIWQRGERNARGQNMSSLLGSNISKISNYDDWGNITGSQLTTSLSSAILDYKNYTYNGANHLMSNRSGGYYGAGLNPAMPNFTDFTWQENFEYDSEKRLKSSLYSLNNQYIGGKTQIYDPNGNLTFKSGIGNISYYEDEGFPYRIKEITSPNEGFSIPRSKEVEKHLYHQTVNYTPFQRVRTIIQDSNNTDFIDSEETASFIYNVNYERVKMRITRAGNVLKQKYYAGDYEIVQTHKLENGIKMAYETDICYIRTPEGLQAAYKRELPPGKV